MSEQVATEWTSATITFGTPTDFEKFQKPFWAYLNMPDHADLK